MKHELQPAIATRHFSQTHGRRTSKTNCIAAQRITTTMSHEKSNDFPMRLVCTIPAAAEPRSWHSHTPQLCRPTNYNVDCSNIKNITHQGTRPAPICAPRGGHRSNPRPGPRRHPLTHAADMGHTSPQRRHQHKAPCIVPLPGAAAATYNTPQTKATLPCINLRYKAGWLYFLLRQDRMETEPCINHEYQPSVSHPD